MTPRGGWGWGGEGGVHVLVSGWGESEAKGGPGGTGGLRGGGGLQVEAALQGVAW